MRPHVAARGSRPATALGLWVVLVLLGATSCTPGSAAVPSSSGSQASTALVRPQYVALADACAHLRSQGVLKGEPLTGSVAAVSVGIIDGVPRLDLPYEEDVRAETDMNIVMTGDGRFVEVQGTAEAAPFDRAELDAMMTLGAKGCADLTALQQAALAS